jgi:hypothetical protein
MTHAPAHKVRYRIASDIARLSAKGGRVFGSGNLTYTGWGGNDELATSWPIGPQEEEPTIERRFERGRDHARRLARGVE